MFEWVLGVLEKVLSLILSAEKIHQVFRRRTPAEVDSSLVVADRFVQLFEAHGVKRPQIPRFFGHGLALHHFKNNEILLEHLTEEILQDAADLFGVNREWLDGASEEIYPAHDFYKRPQDFRAFLTTLISHGSSNRLKGVMLLVKNRKPDEEDALIILEEEIGEIGDKEIYRYYICNNWLYSYWKSRVYMASCICLAQELGVHLLGRYVDAAIIDRYKQGKGFLEYKTDSALPIFGRHWYPTDLAVEPDVFLSGLLAEERKLALHFWLEHYEEGFLRLKVPGRDSQDIYLSFKEALTSVY